MSKTNELTFNNCKTLVITMDINELDELAKVIRFRRNEINRELKDDFLIGDKVSFTGRNNNLVMGTITKINRKNVVVTEDDNKWMAWNVPPSMLTKKTNKGVDNG